MISEAAFTVKNASLGIGDTLFLYTDGVTDSLNIEDKFFGKERLLKLLDGYGATPATLLGKVEAQLTQFMGTVDQFDDITMLALKRTR